MEEEEGQMGGSVDMDEVILEPVSNKFSMFSYTHTASSLAGPSGAGGSVDDRETAEEILARLQGNLRGSLGVIEESPILAKNSPEQSQADRVVSQL
mmetsp:Transcript_10453/g.21755  ORF Transcript_10453/g.21755 Transcript_10453/m.21755 type:complete len:96 (+) Transcript_10453:18-305(+)